MSPCINEVLTGENRLVNDKGEHFTVKYYRREMCLIDPSQEETGEKASKNKIYGVSIIKTQESQRDEIFSINLTDSFEHADFIIYYLTKHKVTPMSALEVIDHIYGLYEEGCV